MSVPRISGLLFFVALLSTRPPGVPCHCPDPYEKQQADNGNARPSLGVSGQFLYYRGKTQSLWLNITRDKKKRVPETTSIKRLSTIPFFADGYSSSEMLRKRKHEKITIRRACNLFDERQIKEGNVKTCHFYFKRVEITPVVGDTDVKEKDHPYRHRTTMVNSMGLSDQTQHPKSKMSKTSIRIGLYDDTLHLQVAHVLMSALDRRCSPFTRHQDG